MLKYLLNIRTKKSNNKFKSQTINKMGQTTTKYCN